MAVIEVIVVRVSLLRAIVAFSLLGGEVSVVPLLRSVVVVDMLLRGVVEVSLLGSVVKVVSMMEVVV